MNVRSVAVGADGLPLLSLAGLQGRPDRVVKVDSAGNVTDVWNENIDWPRDIELNPVESSFVVSINDLPDTVSLPVTISGSASAAAGVESVLVGIRDPQTNLWWNNGSWGGWILNPAETVAATDPSASQVNWTYSPAHKKALAGVNGLSQTFAFE